MTRRVISTLEIEIIVCSAAAPTHRLFFKWFVLHVGQPTQWTRERAKLRICERFYFRPVERRDALILCNLGRWLEAGVEPYLAVQQWYGHLLRKMSEYNFAAVDRNVSDSSLLAQNNSEKRKRPFSFFLSFFSPFEVIKRLRVFPIAFLCCIALQRQGAHNFGTLAWKSRSI